MADFLLELRCEEIPARMQAKASDDLARLFTERLAEAGLKAESLTSYVTPRRLALIAHGLPLRTQAVSEEYKGPRTSAPAQALEGFLRKTGLTQDELDERDGVWFAVVEKPGRATGDVLAEIVPSIIRAFPWPKSMRWGDASITTESLRWVRPLQGIVAILGEELVEMEVEGIRSGFATAGHRFHHPGEITIGSAADYVEKLRACHVIVDQAERQAIIAERANALAAEGGYALIEDVGLVAENAGLTEWPVPLLGRFDPDFLEVPPEVIQLTLRVNQKYFVLRDDAGKLAPAFICTANIDAKDGGKAIVAGNGKVLAARLSDARFFWDQDRKVPLAEQAKKLERITFHEKLGTLADKVERVAKLAEWLAEEGIVPGCDPTLARQAAELCKSDLVSESVSEFPELQGVMGGYYARAEGLPDEVADAIRDHYNTPCAPVSVALALADRLDTLQQFFAINEKPTGSKDPFALRRAALQCLLMIMRGIRVDLATFLSRDVIEFIVERWMAQNRAAGGRPDLIAAVTTELDGDLWRTGQRMRALESFIATDDGANLLAGYKRAANILKKEGFDTVSASLPDRSQLGEEDPLASLDDPDVADAIRVHEAAHPLSYAPEPAEAALIAALHAAEPEAAAAIEAEDFEGAMAALASLRAPIDAFFDTVTVNAPEPEKRAARLALLQRVHTAVHKVADFSKITG